MTAASQVDVAKAAMLHQKDECSQGNLRMWMSPVNVAFPGGRMEAL